MWNDSVRAFHDDDASTVRALWKKSFGASDCTVNTWIDAVCDDRYAATGWVAVAHDAVVGFAITDVGDRAHVRSYLGIDALNIDALNRSLDLPSPSGILHMCVVDAAWRSQGIGSALYARSLSDFHARGIASVVGVSWHRDGVPDSRALFEAHGFSCVAIVHQYYRRVSERLHCPDCSGFCTCTASIYHRRGLR